MQPIKVLVVDDDTVFRMLLCKLLSLQADLEIVGRAAAGAEAVSLYRSLSPDVVLMDLKMPGMDGFTAMERIREHDPSARMIVLTVHNLDECRERSLEAGARAFLVKGTSGQKLVETIRKVATSRASHKTDQKGGAKPA